MQCHIGQHTSTNTPCSTTDNQHTTLSLQAACSCRSWICISDAGPQWPTHLHPCAYRHTSTLAVLLLILDHTWPTHRHTTHITPMVTLSLRQCCYSCSIASGHHNTPEPKATLADADAISLLANVRTHHPWAYNHNSAASHTVSLGTNTPPT
jgi:hypothetical protein